MPAPRKRKATGPNKPTTTTSATSNDARQDKSEAQVWGGRVSSAFNLWRTRAWTQAQQIEDSLSGIFPVCVPGGQPVAPDASQFQRWDYSGSDQVNYNLNLGAVQFMLAQSWDEFPTLHLATKPLNASEDLVTSNERIAQILMDEAEATQECRVAMESAMTRGMFALWYGMGPEIPTADRMAVLSKSAGEVVAEVAEPFIDPSKPPVEVVLSPGMDFLAIAEAAREMASDPVQGAALGLKGIGALLALAQACDEMDEKEREAPTTQPRVRCRPWVQALPLGSWFLFDTSVSRFEKAAWCARKIVYDEEEFQASDVFSDEAKREVKPVKGGYTDGWGSVKYAGMTSGEDSFENARYVIWHIVDKRHLKQHYIAEGYDKFLEKPGNDAYPYMDEYGRPLLPNVFPVVVRTPIRSTRERPEAAYGIAQLAPGWHMQIEFIKLESETLASIKKTARIYRAGPGVDQAEFENVRRGRDGTVVRTRAGPKEENDFSLLPFNAPPPSEYQSGAMRCMFRFATAVRVPSVAFTGEPIADTLGQEQIALQGATTTQSDIIHQYESAFAECAWGILKLWRAYAPDEQIQAYLGAGSTDPRQEPVIGPDGQPLMEPVGGAQEEQGEPTTTSGSAEESAETSTESSQPTPMQPVMRVLPSLWEEWKSVSLDGHKFVAKFASTTRAEDAVRIKQVQDYIALVRGGVTPMGLRLWDETDPMKRLAKDMDMPDPKPYQMSLAEKAQMAMAGGGAGMGRQPPGGGSSDDRKAGGGRGSPNVPGRQTRDRKPDSRSNMHGRANRAASATS